MNSIRLANILYPISLALMLGAIALQILCFVGRIFA